MNWYKEPPAAAATLAEDRGGASAVRRGMVWGLLSALAVLGCTWGASSYQQAMITESAEDSLEMRAATVESAVGTEVARYLGVATVVADGLASLDDVNAATFRSVTGSLDGMGLDGATSIVYIAAPITTADIPAAERRWRSSFSPDLTLVPNDTEGEHVFVLDSVSLDGEPDRPGGVDLTSAAAPFAALMEAQRTGSAAISDAYELLIDQQVPAQERQTSFSLVVPVTNDSAFLGWVLMGLRGQDFLGHVLDVSGEGAVDTMLSAGDTAGVETRVAAVTQQREGRVLDETRDLQVAQQEWTLQIESDLVSLIGPSRLMPRNTRIAGGIASLLLGALVWAVVTGRVRSGHRVRRATADLAAAEEVSRRQVSMLDAMVETIEEVGVSVVDSEGRFLLQSRAARKILGIAGGDGPVADPAGPELWQENFGLFHLDGSVVETSEMPLVRALNGEITNAVPMIVRNNARTDGAQIEVSGRPLSLGGGAHGALAVFRDVTQERLQQAELAGFAGVVAHDLRHPLTVIGGYISMLTDHCLPELEGDPALLAETATYLAKATAGTARMAELISDLLDYTTARDAEMAWRSVDLEALALEVTALHLDTGDDPGRPAPHIHVGQLPVVEGDPDRLRQLLTNLIGNAVKYVAPGTVPLLDLSASEHQGRVRLRFADRGIGIAPSRAGDVFRPFVRAHTDTPEGLAYTGTGLGLAICHQVVLRHGGEISVTENPGGGSIFTVDLPLVRPEGARGDDQPATETVIADDAPRSAVLLG